MTYSQETVSPHDLAIISEQIGRTPRGVVAVSYRTQDSVPGVVMTYPRLEDGTPFPTLYYLTHPILCAKVSQLESQGCMNYFSSLLCSDSSVAQEYESAHRRYLEKRNSLLDLQISFSGGGMPNRVKCLHVLVAHSLAHGPGTNPIGDRVVAVLRYCFPDIDAKILPRCWPCHNEVHLFHDGKIMNP